MKSLNLDNIELFEVVLDFKIGDEYVDLHNDYDCRNVIEFVDEQKIILYFYPLSSNLKRVILLFDIAKIVKTKYPIVDTTKSITLSNFHREKFLTENNTLQEQNKNGQKK